MQANLNLPASIAHSALSSIEAELIELRGSLAAPVLDGTPFAVVAKYQGVEVVYGEWNGTRQWRAVAGLPSHFCGVVTMDEAGANGRVQLTWKVEGLSEARVVHINSLKWARVTELQESVRILRAFLGIV